MSKSNEKLTNSEITGSVSLVRKEPNETGNPLGVIGSAMAEIGDKHPTPEMAGRMKPFLLDLSDRQIRTIKEREAVDQITKAFRKPVTVKWCNGRIAVLLSHYFVGNMEKHHVEAVADDWLNELKDFPAWSIALACKWWISRDNPKRRNKPMPGDIGERAHKEMAFIRVAEMIIARFDRQGYVPPPLPEPKCEPLTPEQLEERKRKVEEIMRPFRKQEEDLPDGQTKRE